MGERVERGGMTPAHYYVKTLEELEAFLDKRAASLRIKKTPEGWTVELRPQGKQPVVQSGATFLSALNRAVAWVGRGRG